MVQVERRSRPRERVAVPGWYWLVAVLLVAWGAMGVYACYLQWTLGADAMGPADSYQRALYASLPAWYNWVYAVATGAGLLGALALTARWRAAQSLFLISLIAVLVQFGWLFSSTDIIAARGAGSVVPFPAFITAVAAFQVWYAGWVAGKGWLK